MKEMTIRFMKACLLFVLCAAASAHHSVGRYDNDNLVTVEGTVSKIEWTSPHVFIHFTAKADDGNGANGNGANGKGNGHVPAVPRALPETAEPEPIWPVEDR